ncbi:MAG: flagellar hook-length control protein FliK [Gammaproteobacteria bacterium]
MAETELILNTNLQTSSSSCISCASVETNGQNISLSGDFSAQLNDSLKELAINSGEVLPIDGKKLPLAIQPETLQSEAIQAIALKELRSNAQSLVNGIQLDDIDSRSLNPIPQDILKVNALNLQDQFDTVSTNILPTVSSLVSELEQNIDSEIQNISEIVTEVSEELIVTPISVNPNQVLPTLTTQVAELTSTPGAIDNQRTLPASIDVEVPSINNKSNVLVDNIVNYGSPQKFDSAESTLDELNNFISNYLSDDNSSKIMSKNQILSSEVFQQNINIVKSDISQLNLNISSGVDTYNNLNTGSLINRPVEAPIPLLIKQGVAPEQIQQSVDQSIEQNVKWLISNKVQNAKINVFPESLGQVNIALNLEDSNLKLNFIATNNATKELIEASIATLKSQFGENGINLQEVNVETRFNHQSNQDSHFSGLNDNDSSQFDNNLDANGADEIELASLEHVNKSTSLNLLDAYV